MTSWRRVGLGVLVLAAAQVTASASKQAQAILPVSQVAVPPGPPTPTPVYIGDRINKLGRNFNGQVGIAVTSIDEGWFASWEGSDLYPQQSVSKLWVAITALDA